MDRELMSTRQAAEYLGIPAKSVGNNWRRYGLTPAKIGKRHVYRKCDLDTFVAAKVQATINAVA